MNDDAIFKVSRRQARQLLDAAPDPTVIVDGQGMIVYANARVVDVLGYAPEELIGEPVEVLLPERFRTAHPTHRGNFFTRPDPRPMGAASDLFALRKDGQEIPVTISLSPVETDAGVLVSSSIRDVSDSKEIERQLVEANRAKSRFLAAASHDLRQPIQTLNLLNRAAKSSVTDRTHQQIIEKQQASLDSMSRLLNALLDISKLEAGIVRLDIADCEVQNIFESLRAEFEDQAQDKGLELVIDRCHGVARSDPQLLTQILENLISNAIRYTRKGFVQLRCLHHDTCIRIEVLDTGLGIPEDELDGIFEEFHQVDSGNDRPEGLGLGLSIVKRTAELLGCPLEVKSSPGSGSVFSVIVPEGDRSILDAEPAVRDAVLNDTGGQILVVDDEPAVLDATRMLLEMEGFDVLTAASTGDAVSIIDDKGSVPDLLITDFHLRNDETGLEVIRAVRNLVEYNIPVILISGDTSDRISTVDLDRTTFFKKPVDVDLVLEEIHHLIGHPK